MSESAPWLDRAAPRWVVGATDWLSGQPWLPQGLAKQWGCGWEQDFWRVFEHPGCPPTITWAHIFGRRNYRRDSSDAYNAVPQ